MERYIGSAVSVGVALGKIKVIEESGKEPRRINIEDAENELLRFNVALETAKTELKELYKEALEKVGEEVALIFDIHRMLLEDKDYLEFIEKIIRSENINAEYAVFVAGNSFSRIFTGINDDYMKERGTDIVDISQRVIRILAGDKEKKPDYEEPVIIVAKDLTPSETIRLDKKVVLAFVTEKGSSNSHTAILAKAMDIPAIVNVDFEGNDIQLFDGKLGIADGIRGDFYIEPDENVLSLAEEETRRLKSEREELSLFKGRKTVTSDGKDIRIYANIDSADEADKALENDAEGVGLLRSEYLYLGRYSPPTEEEQFIEYKTVAEKLNGKVLVIRTIDIGLDKKVGYLGLKEELNPNMGCRGIRLFRLRPNILKTQLRAIYRASMFGNVKVMFPMVISVDEVAMAKKMIEEVKAELTAEEIAYREIAVGIMIETPAAAIISDELAKEADFFSIGTNDLIQYTLAVDRLNETVAPLYNPHHRAVLELVRFTIENARKNGIRVGICGELAGDTEFTETFIEMGVNWFSVTPNRILGLRKKVISL